MTDVQGGYRLCVISGVAMSGRPGRVGTKDRAGSAVRGVTAPEEGT